MEESHKIRIAFDIGGMISKFPRHMKAMMQALAQSELFEVYVLTDMPKEVAIKALTENNVSIEAEKLLCADWLCYGDMCKAVLAEEYCIEILIDDMPGYVAEGVLIGLLLMPRPRLPYNSLEWIHDRS